MPSALTAGLTPTAYKEKMKELSVLSLICSCFYSQPHPNTIYQYGGECPAWWAPSSSSPCSLLPRPLRPTSPHLGSAGVWRVASGGRRPWGLRPGSPT